MSFLLRLLSLFSLTILIGFFQIQAQGSELSEDKIIKEQLSGRKLAVIEGIWLKGGQHFDAIYKRGENYLRFNLDLGKFIQTIYKRNEFEYYGDCKLKINTGLKGIFAETISGEFELISLDDDNLLYTCTREDYVSSGDETITDIFTNSGKSIFQEDEEPKPKDYKIEITFSRYWPKNLKEHNSQY